MKRLFLVLVFLLALLALFSKITVNLAATSNSQAELEARIESYKRRIMRSPSFPCLLKYKAVKESKAGQCSVGGCKGGVTEDLVAAKYMVEGECEVIEDKDFKDLCIALKFEQCNKHSGWRRDFCKGFQQRRLTLMLTAMQQSEYDKTRGWNLYFLGIYHGLKNNNFHLCERYLKAINIDDKDVPLCDQLACQVLFAQDIDAQIDSIARDFGIVLFSLHEKNRSLCNYVRNSKIKRACFRSLIKKSEDFFQ